MKTQKGREKYKLRQQTVEPVFGIIKSVLGFRRFMLSFPTPTRSRGGSSRPTPSKPWNQRIALVGTRRNDILSPTAC